MKSLSETASELRQTHSKEECLRLVYDILAQKFHGERIKTYLKFWELFYNSPEKLWRKQGFLHCTNINKLAVYLLIASGFFKESEIKTSWTQIWYTTPHQYLLVQTENNHWTAIDIWAKRYGINYGDHAHGFH